MKYFQSDITEPQTVSLLHSGLASLFIRSGLDSVCSGGGQQGGYKYLCPVLAKWVAQTRLTARLFTSADRL